MGHGGSHFALGSIIFSFGALQGEILSRGQLEWEGRGSIPLEVLSVVFLSKLHSCALAPLHPLGAMVRWEPGEHGGVSCSRLPLSILLGLLLWKTA